ncbi:MAG: phosphonate ABC transporter ATP-binding protein [Gammaproteobacteria bacterium]|nr:phosphonate ABC transporter ATP-binding protein [Gammaproteobacteria bacterium]MBU1414277.1 phosphonate ABC transporter ATP-binding protein [Gammaproteobacteria bacterium]
MQAISVSALTKTFGDRRALDNVSITVAPGEMVALIGASGSGKSTLLRHLSGFVAGDNGEVAVCGESVQCNGHIARNVRTVRSRIGFIFQQFNLVGRLTLLTNVLTGQLYRIPTHRSLLKLFTRKEREIGMQALAEVGMESYAFQRASTLSGGQQQRAAIARALVQGAKVILADEPIASLDPESSRKVMEILTRVNREHGCAVLVSLHQVDIALRYCPRVVAMRDGRVVFDGPAADLTQAFLQELYCCDPEAACASTLSGNPELVALPLAA